MTTYDVLVTRRYRVRVSDPKLLTRAMDDIRSGQTLAETYTGGGSFSVAAGKTVVKLSKPRRRASYATATTIHGALRALREKVEAKP